MEDSQIKARRLVFTPTRYRRHYQLLVLVYKALNNLGPSNIREFFKLTTVGYNLRGIETKLVLPNFNLEWVHKSFSYIVANLWNSLPVKIREVEGIDEFKKAVRDDMF